jgi:beta-glucosidase
MMGAGTVAAWLASPARALLQAAAQRATPAFIDSLIARMTVEEKAGQLSLMASAWGPSAAIALNPPNDSNFPRQLEETRQGQLTGIFNGNGARMARTMQNVAVNESRMKIPLIFAADIIHGHRTVFPVPVAEAASFEPELTRRTSEVAAFEAAGSGIDWNFAPMVDIARDQRWGRTMEGAGEDVHLGMLFAAARVRGFQGNDLRSNEHMLATAKHFAAYGAALGGRDYDGADISERTLNEVHLPPFHAAAQAGAGSFMAAFNTLGGVPMHPPRPLLPGLRRG